MPAAVRGGRFAGGSAGSSSSPSSSVTSGQFIHYFYPRSPRRRCASFLPLVAVGVSFSASRGQDAAIYDCPVWEKGRSTREIGCSGCKTFLLVILTPLNTAAGGAEEGKYTGEKGADKNSSSISSFFVVIIISRCGQFRVAITMYRIQS